MEDKQLICTKLRDTLKLMRQNSDLLDLIYVQEPNGNSHVLAVYPQGRIHINTTYDSGIALIVDVLKKLGGGDCG